MPPFVIVLACRLKGPPEFLPKLFKFVIRIVSTAVNRINMPFRPTPIQNR